MTTGTTAEFLELPEDINPPKPGYFHDVFHLVHAYIELVEHMSGTPVPGTGLIKLYGHRSGALDLDTTVLEGSYRTIVTVDRTQQEKLRTFAMSSIAFNIQTLYQLLSNTISRDLIRNFGDDRCLTSEVEHALNQFAKIQRLPGAPKDQRRDNMIATVRTCNYNATYPRGGSSSSEAIVRTINVLDLIMREGATAPFDVDCHHRILCALKIIFYIGVRYYHLNLLRFSDEIIKRSYDRVLKITDLTLAAVPFDPILIQSCSDETASISRWGIEYLQALEAVLLYFGGVRYAAVFTVEANGNQGITDVQ